MGAALKTVISFIRWLGWRGILAAVLLAMLAWSNASRDRIAAKLVNARHALGSAELALRAANVVMTDAADELRRTEAAQRACALNTGEWSKTTGVVNEMLGQCQAENTRLAIDAKRAQVIARAAERRAENSIDAAGQRFNAASPHCIAALKQMESACTGQL